LSELADIVNALFLNGIPERKLSDLLKSIDRPENCSMLTKTCVNQLIWDLLSDYTRGDENKTQYKQGLVIKAAILITKMFDKLDIFRKDNENFPTDIIDLGTDALGLLGHLNRLLQTCPEGTCTDLILAMSIFIYVPHQFLTHIFYMEMTYLKKVSDIDSVHRIGKRVGMGRGFGYGRYPRRYGRA
jgi:hypothetical protein